MGLERLYEARQAHPRTTRRAARTRGGVGVTGADGGGRTGGACCWPRTLEQWGLPWWPDPFRRPLLTGDTPYARLVTVRLAAPGTGCECGGGREQ
jgi:hypothetical protein